jgi:hypothetical protein
MNTLLFACFSSVRKHLRRSRPDTTAKSVHAELPDSEQQFVGQVTYCNS